MRARSRAHRERVVDGWPGRSESCGARSAVWLWRPATAKREAGVEPEASCERPLAAVASARAASRAEAASWAVEGASGHARASVVRTAREQDAEHGAGERRIAVEEGTETLRKREHPLADGQRRQHVIGEVSGHMDHTACVTRRADAAPLARERDQALAAATVTAGPGKAVGEDAAAQVGAEVVLDPQGHAVAHRIGLAGAGEKRFQVVLDNGVKGGRGRIPRPVDGSGPTRLPERRGGGGSGCPTPARPGRRVHAPG